MPDSAIKIENEKPAEIAVKKDPPVLAKIEVKQEPIPLVKADAGLSKAPDTTIEEDKHSASQRKVNLIWEVTQGAVSIVVTITACAVAIILIFRNEYTSAMQLISSMVFLVLSFYFARSNHTNVGGVKLPYQGR